MSERALSAAQGSKRLSERRSRRRRFTRVVSGILFLFLLIAIVWGLRQDSVRIARVAIYGADASFSEYARAAMRGDYFGIIPRDSIFFFPSSNIRASILAEYPNIAAVSFFREGLTGLSIKIHDRAPIARWCGLAPTWGVEEYCYVFDASGYIYAAFATTTETINNFALYAPLVGETLEPLRATIAQEEKIPGAFDFARQLGSMGSPVTRVVIRGDEADDYLASGTRITYVLGQEQNAFNALVSAYENMNLSDGSLEYADLRFSGKVYLMRKQ